MGCICAKEKLKLLKKELKIWQKEVFSKLDNSIEEKKVDIEKLDLLDDAFGLDEEEAARRNNIMEALIKDSSWKEAQHFQNRAFDGLTMVTQIQDFSTNGLI